MKSIIRKLLKKLFGIDGIGLFVKKQKKKINKLFYQKKFTADDLVKKMCEMGMTSGSVVFIHSSMTEFYNYKGTPEEFITKIINVIGYNGTLIMPAYPKSKFQNLNNNEVDFDLRNTKSGAGYLSEIFRKYPGVKRSINLQHSVCAIGKYADFFTSEHHKSETAWDEFSPYYKMSQVNTLVFALGLPYFLGTMIHCTESLLRKKYKYFDLFFSREITYTYSDLDNNINSHTMLTSNIARKRSKKKIIKKYFDKEEFHVGRISNLRIEMVSAKYTLDLFLNLAEKGITMYSKPSTRGYIINKKFIQFNEYKE